MCLFGMGRSEVELYSSRIENGHMIGGGLFHAITLQEG